MKNRAFLPTVFPRLRATRRVTPLLRLELAGPFKKNILTNQAGHSLEHAGVEKVTRVQAQRFASLVNLAAAAQLAKFSLTAIGVYNSPVGRFEIRWKVPQGGYYRLSEHLDYAVDRERLIARYYGYQQCCVPMTSWRNLENYQASDFCGTGFIPCPACYAKKSYSTMVHEIASRRVCLTPFPEARFAHDAFLTAQAIFEGKLIVPVKGDRVKPVSTSL